MPVVFVDLCVVMFSLRVSGWRPRPEEVLGSDPGSPRRALQWYLVITAAGASPVRVSLFCIILRNQENCTDFKSQDQS